MCLRGIDCNISLLMRYTIEHGHIKHRNINWRHQWISVYKLYHWTHQGRNFRSESTHELPQSHVLPWDWLQYISTYGIYHRTWPHQTSHYKFMTAMDLGLWSISMNISSLALWTQLQSYYLTLTARFFWHSDSKV